MVKKETIHRLVADKLVPVFQAELASYNFKYNKGKSSFLKKVKEYELNVSLSGHAASIEYDESKDCIYLFFKVCTSVSIPAYDKWYMENLGERSGLSSRVSYIKLYTILDFSDFSEADFFTPSKAVAFKNYISGALKSHAADLSTSGDKPLADFIVNIETELAKLNERADVNAIFESRDFPLSKPHINLLVWDKQIDKAIGFYNQAYESYLKAVVQEKSAQYLEGFEKLLREAERLLQLKYDNPFIPKLLRSKDASRVVELAAGHKYRSVVRFEGDVSKVRTGIYNENTGDCFLLFENRTIFKVDKTGSIVFEKQIELSTSFDHRLFAQGLEFVRNSHGLSLGRYILTHENSLVDIQAHIRSDIKPKEKVNFTINDAVFISEEKGYMILCSYNNINSIVCLFDKDLNYIKEYYLGGSPVRIVESRGWTIINNGKHVFFGSDAVKLFELEYGNGNRNIEVSNKGEHAVSFGYATKSDIYNLTTMKSQVLWAHPTYLKNYKEVLYNDTHHNFDLSIAKFSPDDKYLIGGGHHGKYVAWVLPKFERIELLPEKEYLPFLTGAEIVSLDGSLFLKNRGHGIRNIQFFNDSNNFITQLGPYNFLWNKEFKNTGCLPVQGIVKVLSDKYITNMNENVFTIFRREE
jgi:hypothetical protein